MKWKRTIFVSVCVCLCVFDLILLTTLFRRGTTRQTEKRTIINRNKANFLSNNCKTNVGKEKNWKDNLPDYTFHCPLSPPSSSISGCYLVICFPFTLSFLYNIFDISEFYLLVYSLFLSFCLSIGLFAYLLIPFFGLSFIVC